MKWIVKITFCVLTTSFLHSCKSDSTITKPIDNEEQFACGTSSLPQNTIWKSDLPGRKIFDQHCAACHAKADKNLTGPSVVHSEFTSDSTLFEMFLFNDPQERLGEMKSYINMYDVYRYNYHSKNKFEFQDSLKKYLKEFLKQVDEAHVKYNFETEKDSAQNSLETSKLSNEATQEKFDWSINILDLWIIEESVTCDQCETSTAKTIAMTDIQEALSFLENLTGIKSYLKYNLGTTGIFLTDGSSYESDKRKWVVWFNNNAN